MNLGELLSPQAGQDRRAWLNSLDERIDDTLGYYLKPMMPQVRAATSAAAMVSPGQDVADAYAASGDMMRPGATALDRAGAGAALVGALMMMGMPGGAASVRRGFDDVVDAGAKAYDPTVLSANGGRDEQLWHPMSSVKLSRPVDEMEFSATPTGTLEDYLSINPESLQGKTLIPAYGDRTAAGAVLSSIDGRDLDSDVLLQGGQGFMRERGTGIWASESVPMQTKANVARDVAEAGGDPLMVYTAMGAQAGDFSHMMSDAVMGQISGTAITDAAASAYDDIIRSRVDANWPGIKAPSAREYVARMSGTNRRLLWQEMDKSALRGQGFPDIAATRNAITDPQLRDILPMWGGTSIGRPETSGVLLADPDVDHMTYNSQLGGEYVGGIQPIPGEILWRDFFNSRRTSGARPAGDQRAMMMQSRMTQQVDQQMVDEIMDYLQRVDNQPNVPKGRF